MIEISSCDESESESDSRELCNDDRYDGSTDIEASLAFPRWRQHSHLSTLMATWQRRGLGKALV